MNQGLTGEFTFPTTKWTLVAQASASDPANRILALEELCGVYWPPLYAFIRSKGVSPTEAEDITQGFFSDLLAQENFGNIEESRGRLRSYLLGGISKFMAKDWRDRNRQKRGGGTTVVPLEFRSPDGSNGIIEIADGETPEALFERQWAVTVIQQTIDSLAKTYEEKGQSELFDSLRFVIVPDEEKRRYKDIAKETGLSVSAVKAKAYRLRERFVQQLRSTIADTLLDPSEIDDEIRWLMSVFK